MRSGIISPLAECSSFMPVMRIISVPSPFICTPMRRSISARLEISGSFAAFSIKVVPSASDAAIIKFSVAPTDGKSSVIVAPLSRPAVAVTAPPLSSMSAPIFASPLRWKSSGRLPRSQPPGSGMTARPHLAVSGPRTSDEARILRTSSTGVSHSISSGTFIVMQPFSNSTSAPRWHSRRHMVRMS